ncbi:hypothetical protein XELAEV_18026203mg [Xenopus laevis]|uniref:Uncharacterized protein n=1 Tax=Xenopus laevis TaxID=8355 RepID=A0A974CVT5_XENLA|nr:hypothetical protein XELAEV_18026203mg [Xenopus laevis]
MFSAHLSTRVPYNSFGLHYLLIGFLSSWYFTGLASKHQLRVVRVGQTYWLVNKGNVIGPPFASPVRPMIHSVKPVICPIMPQSNQNPCSYHNQHSHICKSLFRCITNQPSLGQLLLLCCNPTHLHCHL